MHAINRRGITQMKTSFMHHRLYLHAVNCQASLVPEPPRPLSRAPDTQPTRFRAMRNTFLIFFSTRREMIKTVSYCCIHHTRRCRGFVPGTHRMVRPCCTPSSCCRWSCPSSTTRPTPTRTSCSHDLIAQCVVKPSTTI